MSSKAFIRAKASHPDSPPIWIGVHYMDGSVDGFMDGALVIMLERELRPRTGHIGLFSSEKGVDFYQGLLDKYAVLAY